MIDTTPQPQPATPAPNPWPAVIRDLLSWPPHDGRGGLARLAHTLGVPVATLRGWKGGRRIPSNDARERIRRACEAYRPTE